MGFSLLTQVALIVISVTLVFTYIRPTLAEVSLVQDELFQYSDTVSKAEEFNSRLRELIAKERSFSAQNLDALANFLPQKLDPAHVMRDVEFIASGAGVTLDSITAAEVVSPVQNFAFEDEIPNAPVLPFSDVTIGVSGSYSSIKYFLSELERNAYLLEVVALTLSQNESSDVIETSNLSPTELPFSLSVTTRVYALSDTSAETN